MNIERRALRSSEVRVTPDNPRTFEAVVLRYNVLDDYRTIFDPGVFKDSLEERLPRITWAHDWSEPLGRYVDYKDDDDKLTLVGEFDDFAAVPRAKQASAQLASGTIDQFSVGFHRKPEGTYEDADGVEHFRNAGLDEAALVLVGAVPGTELLGMRSVMVRTTSGLLVPEDVWVTLGKKVAAGEMTHAEALAALDLAAGHPPTEVVTEPPGVLSDDVSADADAALEGLGL